MLPVPNSSSPVRTPCPEHMEGVPEADGRQPPQQVESLTPTRRGSPERVSLARLRFQGLLSPNSRSAQLRHNHANS